MYTISGRWSIFFGVNHSVCQCIYYKHRFYLVINQLSYNQSTNSTICLSFFLVKSSWLTHFSVAPMLKNCHRTDVILVLEQPLPTSPSAAETARAKVLRLWRGKKPGECTKNMGPNQHIWWYFIGCWCLYHHHVFPWLNASELDHIYDRPPICCQIPPQNWWLLSLV